MIPIQKRFVFLLLGLAALAAMGLVYYATIYGPGVGGDATIYLTSARNLIDGKGLGWMEADGSFRLLPYTPPFYPLSLSVIGWFGDMTAGARWFNILLFGGTVLLIGWAFMRFTGQGWLAVILGGLIAASPVLVGVQVWAMSEPVFLLLGFSGLIVLLLYLESRTQTRLFAAAVLLGLAFLTRYIGLAFVVTGGLALILFGRGADRRIKIRLNTGVIKEALAYSLVALLPMLIWLLVDFSITGTVGSRSSQPVSAYWQRFLEIGPALQKIYLFWLLPDSVANRLPGILQLAAWLIPLVVGFVVMALIIRRLPAFENGKTTDPSHVINPSAIRLVGMFGLFIFVYLIVMAAAQVFTYPPITLASRMLSPVHLAVLVLVCGLIHLAQDILLPGKRMITTALMLGMLVWIGSYGLRSVLIARDYHTLGIGYNALAWRNSPTIEALRQLPVDIPLISNESTVIMYLADRPAYALQEIYRSQPDLEPYSAYGSGSDPAQRVFRDQDGALVLFDANLREDFAMYGEQVEQRLQALTLNLYPYHKGEDGSIYFYKLPEFLESSK